MRIAYVSLLMVAVTFVVFEWELARGSSLEVARTAAVNMLVMGEMVYLFNVRHFTALGAARGTSHRQPGGGLGAASLVVPAAAVHLRAADAGAVPDRAAGRGGLGADRRRWASRSSWRSRPRRRSGGPRGVQRL